MASLTVKRKLVYAENENSWCVSSNLGFFQAIFITQTRAINAHTISVYKLELSYKNLGSIG
jgi:peroxiredoxin